MITTTFLALIIGWYLVIFSLLLLFQPQYLESAMKDILAQRGLFFLLSLITLILGLLLVTSHNIWVMGCPIIITIFCWLVLISGVFRLFFPDIAIKLAESFLNSPAGMQIAGIVCLMIGIFLLYSVYYIELYPLPFT